MLSKLLFAAELPTWALFAEMTLAAAVVIVAGARFTRLADRLAERLHLAAGWVGLILLATVTSLPELVTGGTATWIGNVDLALGNIFGSCSFNITIILLLNAMWGGGSVLRGVSPSHALTSSFGLVLTGLALMGIVLADKFAGHPRLAQLTELFWALAILITYLSCIRLVHRYERRNNRRAVETSERHDGNSTIYVQMIVIATILVGASWWLTQIGDTLSTHEIKLIGRPLGATFVGALFLALATSLPEIVTSIAAVRLGKLDLALGNIFGSNMFNIFVIPMLKGLSIVRGEPLLLEAGAGDGTQNLIAGLLAMLLTAIAIGGLAYQSRRKLLGRFGFDSILIAATYVGGTALLLMNAG